MSDEDLPEYFLFHHNYDWSAMTARTYRLFCHIEPEALASDVEALLDSFAFELRDGSGGVIQTMPVFHLPTNAGRVVGVVLTQAKCWEVASAGVPSFTLIPVGPSFAEPGEPSPNPHCRNPFWVEAPLTFTVAALDESGVNHYIFQQTWEPAPPSPDRDRKGKYSIDQNASARAGHERSKRLRHRLRRFFEENR